MCLRNIWMVPKFNAPFSHDVQKNLIDSDFRNMWQLEIIWLHRLQISTSHKLVIFVVLLSLPTFMKVCYTAFLVLFNNFPVFPMFHQCFILCIVALFPFFIQFSSIFSLALIEFLRMSHTIELVSKELNHLAAILHVYAGGLNFIR